MLKTIVGSLALACAVADSSHLRGDLRGLASSSGEKPNILLIVADDQGNGDIGYNTPAGQKFHTPNLDAIAKDGIKLSRMYVGKTGGNTSIPMTAAINIKLC